MKQNHVIETIGSITKMEHLRAQEQGVLGNTLVLNTVSPFPGIKEKNIAIEKGTNNPINNATTPNGPAVVLPSVSYPITFPCPKKPNPK